MGTEKKVEINAYPIFVAFIKRAFPKAKVEAWFGTDDFPEHVKDCLKSSSKKTEGKGRGIPDAIIYVESVLEKMMFVFEAKASGIGRAQNESEHYCKALSEITSNLFRCSIDKNNFKIIHHHSGKDMGISNVCELESGQYATDPKLFVAKLKNLRDWDKKSDDGAKNRLLQIVKALSSTLRKAGLAGQDRIDFASSLFLIKEIYDAVDGDFRSAYFGGLLNSPDIATTLNEINRIATLERIKSIFPDFSHLITKGQLINLERFNKVMSNTESESEIKASGLELNEKIKQLLRDDVINLSQADFDFRGLIVEEFTHGNKGGGVSKEFGEFFTPRHVIRFAIDLAGLSKDDKVFDPAFGTGGFLIEAFKRLVALNGGHISDRLRRHAIYGNELHDWNVKAAKASLIALGDGHSNLFNTDFIKGFSTWNIDKDPQSTGELFPDVVLMNPPYSLGAGQTEWDFVDKCFKQLLKAAATDRKERTLVAVLPYEETGEGFLHRLSKYIDAYVSLPYGVFLKYTSVRTQIVVMKTTPKYRSDASDMEEPLFVAKVEHDGFSLDNFRRPCAQNDLPAIAASYQRYKTLRLSARTQVAAIEALSTAFAEGEISRDEYVARVRRVEDELSAVYSDFESTDKSALLSYTRDVLKTGHFDRALWLFSNDYPTLGDIREGNKPISHYFDVVKDKGDFSKPDFEDLPYIEIGGIDLQSGFYQESDKPKAKGGAEAGAKQEKAKGEISGGTHARKGDVLISMVRTYRGAFTVLREDAVVSKTGFLVLRPKAWLPENERLSSNELLSMLRISLPRLVRFINYVGTGKTYPKMTITDFCSMLIDKNFSSAAKTENVKAIIKRLCETYDLSQEDVSELARSIMEGDPPKNSGTAGDSDEALGDAE